MTTQQQRHAGLQPGFRIDDAAEALASLNEGRTAYCPPWCIVDHLEAIEEGCPPSSMYEHLACDYGKGLQKLSNPYTGEVIREGGDGWHLGAGMVNAADGWRSVARFHLSLRRADQGATIEMDAAEIRQLATTMLKLVDTVEFG